MIVVSINHVKSERIDHIGELIYLVYLGRIFTLLVDRRVGENIAHSGIVIRDVSFLSDHIVITFVVVILVVIVAFFLNNFGIIKIINLGDSCGAHYRRLEPLWDFLPIKRYIDHIIVHKSQ